MNVTLEAVGAATLDVLLVLQREFYVEAGYDHDPAAARAAAAQLVAAPELGRAWFVRADEERVGYVVVAFGFSLEYHGRDAIIDELYVQPERRGAGAGAAAMRLAEERAQELGVHALHLEVERSNERARSLYGRLGYGGNDRMLLTKRLAR